MVRFLEAWWTVKYLNFPLLPWPQYPRWENFWTRESTSSKAIETLYNCRPPLEAGKSSFITFSTFIFKARDLPWNWLVFLAETQSSDFLPFQDVERCCLAVVLLYQEVKRTWIELIFIHCVTDSKFGWNTALRWSDEVVGLSRARCERVSPGVLSWPLSCQTLIDLM